MKLGVLVVVAVAVLLPSLSEGRTVSVCELREELDEAINLPRRLQRFKERILAIVICEVKRKSSLETGLVKVWGKRRTTTTAGPTTTRGNDTNSGATTTKPLMTKPVMTKPMMTKPQMTKPQMTKPQMTKPQMTKPQMTKPVMTKPVMTKPVMTKPQMTKPVMTKPQMTKPVMTKPQMTKPATTATTAETNQTEPNTTESGGSRPKRDADEIDDESDENGDESNAIGDESDSIGNESDSTEMAAGLEEAMTEVEADPDEELGLDDDLTGDEDEESDEEDLVEGGNRKRRATRRRWRKKKLSLGFYGLFQLSDRLFCDSGYRRSYNKCNSPCEAFADDDITDDIGCFVDTKYWWILLKKASRRCYRTYNIFRGCD